MGGSEIIVILIVALLFLGPDKLPGAAKTISKGIRDIKKQSRALQQQIEGDEQIGGAIRDLKSALRGDEAPVRPKIRPIKPRKELGEAVADGAVGVGVAGDEEAEHAAAEAAAAASAATGVANESGDAGDVVASLEHVEITSRPSLTMPPMAGEPGEVSDPVDDAELAAMVKPAPGTIAKGS